MGTLQSPVQAIEELAQAVNATKSLNTNTGFTKARQPRRPAGGNKGSKRMASYDGDQTDVQDRQREEFILFLMDILGFFGMLAGIVVTVTYRDAFPGAELVGPAVSGILLGFVFERGAMSSDLPARFRDRMWWFGPAFFFALILLKTTIENIPVLPSWDDLPILAESALFVFGSWIVGAGLKRLVVRGRFEKAYRGMVTRSGDRRYDFDWRFVSLMLILVVIVDLFAFWSDGEGFLEALSASVMFFIVANACLPYFTGRNNQAVSRKGTVGTSADRQMLEELRDELRGRFLPYLRRAFQLIPPMTSPRVLDIGCGSGVPTIELARLSGGDVTGIDIDSDSLKRLKKRARAAGLTGRVHIVHGSMTSMNFPAASYDILWAEGAANVIGFEQALRDWKRFLRLGGFLVVHDSVEDFEQTREQIAVQGYQLLGSFVVTSDVWWKEYFEPLQRAVQEARRQGPRNPRLLAALEQADREVQGCLEHPEENQSVYLVMHLQ